MSAGLPESSGDTTGQKERWGWRAGQFFPFLTGTLTGLFSGGADWWQSWGDNVMNFSTSE